MDTSKLITVAVWATVFVVAYEAFQKVQAKNLTQAPTSGSTIIPVGPVAPNGLPYLDTNPPILGNDPIFYGDYSLDYLSGQ